MADALVTSTATDDLHYDIIVIGCGAAGLMAAGRAAELGARTLLIERNRKAGVKILMSGGTRCNLTHDCEADGILRAFGSAASFLRNPLKALGPRELVAWFAARGLPTTVEQATGKIFPASNKARDVVLVLLAWLEETGAELSLAEKVLDLAREEAHFAITTARRRLTAERVILTTGGRSYPGCGTTGDGYRWLEALGHTIRPPRPALVPLTTPAEWVTNLSGIALEDVRLRVRATTRDSARRVKGLPQGVLIERRGALLLTHHGLSGPAAMDVSREVTRPEDPASVELECDWLPERSREELDAWLTQAQRQEGKRQVAGLVAELLPRRLVEALFALAEVPLERRAAELPRAERARLLEVLKAAAIPVSGSRGFEKAEVTAGGLALDEVDPRSLRSRRVPGLWLAGEILDLDGYIGGYNFQAAFSTGWVAGTSAARGD